MLTKIFIRAIGIDMMLYTKADISQKDGKIVGIASSSVLDRQGEIVNVDGWDLKNFKKAPRLLWAHDHNEPTIGKVTKIGLEGEGKKRRLTFEAVFQEVTEKARAVKKLVEDGFINTFSVGFKPVEMDGATISKQELLEISVVNVPANPEAMLLAYKSLKSEGFNNETINKVLDDEVIKSLADFESRLSDVEEKAELAVKGLRHLNPQPGRNRNALTDRQTLTKVIAKTADRMLAERSDRKMGFYVKVIKHSSEQLIRSHKEELNGK